MDVLKDIDETNDNNKYVLFPVEERCGKRVAGNVVDLQTHTFGKTRESWTRTDSPTKIPIGYIRVSQRLKLCHERQKKKTSNVKRVLACNRVLSLHFQTQEGENGPA